MRKAVSEEGLRKLLGWLKQRLSNKQDKLISGVNLKTFDGETLLGSGDIQVVDGGVAKPWCRGTIQNRSIAAATWALVTPIATHGDVSLISNGAWRVPKAGLYTLMFSGSIPVGATSGQLIRLVKNDTAATAANVVASSSSQAVAVFDSLCYADWLEEGDTLRLLIYSSIARSGIHSGQPPTFYFKQEA